MEFENILVNVPVLLKSISLSYTLNDGSFKYFVRSTNNLETTGLVSYADLPNADTFHIQYQNHIKITNDLIKSL